MAKKEKREIICGIYKITNKINNKGYIGQSNNIYSRWQSYKTTLNYDEFKTVPIHVAFKEFGFDNFNFEIICKCSEEELNKLETKYIKEHNTCIKWINSWGYNIYEGGSSAGFSRKTKLVRCITTGKEYKSAKEAYFDTGCSQINIRRCCNGNYEATKDINGNKLSWEFIIEETKLDKMIRLIEQYKCEIPSDLCECLSEYIKEINKDKIYFKSESIYSFDLKGNFIKEWTSQLEVSKELNITEKTVNNALEGKMLKAGGNIICKKEDYESGNFNVDEIVDKIKNYSHPSAVKIVQLDSDNNYLSTFNSLKIASTELNIKSTTISNILMKRNIKTKDGFKFMYLSDYENTKQNIKIKRS